MPANLDNGFIEHILYNKSWHLMCYNKNMTLKHTIAGHKTWEHTGPFGFSPSEMLGKLLKVLKFEAPVGYQDENGFHYGTKPVQDRNNWPMN
jgi:hypothetical protein